MATKFTSVREANGALDDLAIDQMVEIAGRFAKVVRGTFGKALRFTTTHHVDVCATTRPQDGRTYVKGADVSKQLIED